MTPRPEPSAFRVCRDLPVGVGPHPPSHPPLAIAIGNFDGLHHGHRAVLDATTRAAAAMGVIPAVLTFEPHPRMFFAPRSPSIRLMPFAEKARALRGLGIGRLLALRFNRAMMEMTAEAFVREILAGFNARHVVTGEGFVFGHRRQGDTGLLAALAPAAGFTYQTVAPVAAGGRPCSSTRLREALRAGDPAGAAALTGAPYVLEGRVVRGDGRGRQLGFPTANVHLPPDKFLPADGVYAVHAEIGGRRYPAVANLGMRPTFDGTRRSFEVHLLDGGGDLYGRRLRAHLLHRVRGEKRFDGIEALKRQIAQDIQDAQQRLEHAP